jgi:septum site-determining protein MinC
VVVIGDVNPGAEVIAGGSVVVWGRLRGSVHAGAEGDSAAVVCALEMDPIQVRISDKVLPSGKRKPKPQPEILRIQNNELTAETWQYKK